MNNTSPGYREEQQLTSATAPVRHFGYLDSLLGIVQLPLGSQFFRGNGSNSLGFVWADVGLRIGSWDAMRVLKEVCQVFHRQWTLQMRSSDLNRANSLAVARLSRITLSRMNIPESHSLRESAWH